MDVKTSLLLRKNEWEHLQNMAMVKQSLIFTAVSLSKFIYSFFWGGGGETYNCFLFDPSELFVKIM